MLAANVLCLSRTHKESERRLFKARAHCQHWTHCGLDARNARVGAPRSRSSITAVGIVGTSRQLPIRSEQRNRSARPDESRELGRPTWPRCASHPAGRAPTALACSVVERMLSRRPLRLESWRQRAPAARPAAVQQAVMNLEDPCRRLPTSGAVKRCRTVPLVENTQHACDPCKH